MGRNKGWRPTREHGNTHLQCLDCGKFYDIRREANADSHTVALDLIQHDNDCVPGKDKAPTGPIGLAFGMSIQLRDLFAMQAANAFIDENNYPFKDVADMAYQVADEMLKAREKE
jgi:hypothetical protein